MVLSNRSKMYHPLRRHICIASSWSYHLKGFCGVQGMESWGVQSNLDVQVCGIMFCNVKKIDSVGEKIVIQSNLDVQVCG